MCILLGSPVFYNLLKLYFHTKIPHKCVTSKTTVEQQSALAVACGDSFVGSTFIVSHSIILPLPLPPTAARYTQSKQFNLITSTVTVQSVLERTLDVRFKMFKAEAIFSFHILNEYHRSPYFIITFSLN